MAEPSVAPELGALFQQCLAAFRALLQDLRDRDLNDLVSQAADEYGRLKVWGHDFRADLPDRSRSSLGDKLRLDYELRRDVVRAFEQLSRQILLASRFLSNATQPNIIIPTDDADDDNTDSESSEGGDLLLRMLETIFEQIQLLYHLGILIRRQAFCRRYLKSTTSSSKDTKDIIYIIPEDISHVREIIRQWRGQPQRKLPEEEEAVSWDALMSENEGDTKFRTQNDVDVRIVERLALANSRRREQFAYWTEHPDEPVTLLSDSKTPETTLAGSSSKQQPLHNMNSVKFHATSSFSQDLVTRSDIFGPNALSQADTQSRAPQTTYTPTVFGGTHSARVPRAPEEAENFATFECPYCHLELDSSAMKDRMTWKRHVFRDLRPYTCTHLDCPTGDKLYSSRSDWIYHEMQIHRRRWVCEPCQEVMISPTYMSAHLGSIHRVEGPIKDSLLSIYERPMDGLESATCPLCPMTSTLESMLSHLAEHMEDLSLFALPKLGENTEMDKDRPSQVLEESEDSKFQPTSPRLPKEAKERIATLPARITSVLNRIAHISYTELEAENLKLSMAEIEPLLGRTLADLKEAEANSLKLLLGDHDKNFDNLACDALDLCLQLHELLAAAFGTTGTTLAGSMNLDRSSILARTKLADPDFQEKLRKTCNELIGIIAVHLIVQGVSHPRALESSATMPSALPESSTPPKKNDYRHESSKNTPLKTLCWRCDRCLELNQDVLNDQCNKCSHRYCEQCTYEEHETWDHNHEQKKDNAHHIAEPESSLKTGTATENKATQVPSSRRHGVSGARTVSSEARSSAQSKFVLWICHLCGQDNILESTDMCINPQCMHAYCNRCSVEEHEVPGS